MADATNPNDLITIGDLRDLGVEIITLDDEKRAAKWITYVSNYLRVIATNNGINLDEKLKIDGAAGGQYRSVVEMVVSNAVVRGYSKNVDVPDATQWSQAATPYSESFTVPAGGTEAYFKHKELALLGFMSVSGRGQMSIMRGVRG